MDLALKGKVAFVLGGTSGIGFAIAEALVKEGADTIVASRDFNHVDKAVKYLKRINPAVKVMGKQIDLLDAKKIQKIFSETLKQTTIDILVNNVGGPASGLTPDIAIEDWDKGYQTLLRSTVLTTKAVLPGMKKKKWGRILNITSTAAKEVIPKLPVSATFRAGLTAYVKVFARDTGRDGILINNLLPGPTNTTRLSELKKKSPAFFNSMAEETALGRIAEPEEIARIAVFLCSGANTFITGTDILADGGYTKAL